MPKREVDKRKTAKALRKLRQAAERAGAEGSPDLTTWEKDFVDGVTGRLEKYGSAFRDPGKGRLEEALSQRQAQVARVIDKKTRKPKTAAPDADRKTSGKSDKPGLQRSEFKRKNPMRSSSKSSKAGWKPRVRDINDDPTPASRNRKEAVQTAKRPSLTVIPGGKRS